MIFGDERLPWRFWEKVYPEPNTGCWLWAACLVDGYGTFALNKKTRKAHRLTAQAADGIEIDHLCRVRSCVNPDHLEPVPHKTNVLRGEAFAAKQARQTHCIRNHPLSGSNLYVVPSTGARQCVACKRARRADEHRRRRARLALHLAGRTGRPPGSLLAQYDPNFRP